MTTPTTNFMKIFDEFFDDTLNTTSHKCPAHDVIENDDEYIIEMELAGVKKEDISIEIDDGVLTIETERIKNETRNYKRNEIYAGKYKRSFVLPDNTDSEEIKAVLDDGILTVTIHKAIEEVKKKKQVLIK